MNRRKEMFNKALIIGILFLISSCSDVKKWRHACIKVSSVNELGDVSGSLLGGGWEMVNFAPTGGTRDSYVACFKKKS
mgnify:CR=1 FL=1